MTLSRLVPEPEHHLHLSEEHCPVCDQTITNEKFREIQGRIRAEEQAKTAEIEVALKQQFSAQIAQVQADGAQKLSAAQAAAAATLEAAKAAAAAQEKAARAEAKADTEAALGPKVAEAELALAAAKKRAEELASTREAEAAERARELEAAAAREQAIRDEAKAALESASKEADAREAAIREEARVSAEAAYLTKVAEAEAGKEAAKALTATLAAAREKDANERAQEIAAAALREQTLRDEAKATLENFQQEAAAKETAIREEARLVAEATLLAKVTEAETAKVSLELQVEQGKVEQNIVLEQRLKEQREALEKDRDDKLNAEKAKAFEERQKVEAALQQAQRQLQNMSSYELGEGAEVDLHEELRAAFEGDKINRVDKGVPGADIIHEVMHNGMCCGKIVYDSKNRKAWQNEYVAKLRSDQLAEKADHAVLSSSVFPAGTRQVHQVDGIIIANPARVTVLADILRRQIVRMHELRVSNERREEKTSTLYAFMTSEVCSQLLASVESIRPVPGIVPGG